jgi:GR25 family glycosyltransferase involved in LPS biosynthesis
VTLPRIVCLTLPRDTFYSPAPEACVRTSDATVAHFNERGVEATFFYGLNAHKLGIDTSRPYEVDGGKGCGYLMGPARVGCWVSHRALWAALMLLPDERFIVLEDDALFPEDWRPRLEQAIEDAGADCDMLYIGSCCAGNRHNGHIHMKGHVYQPRPYPLCTHGYMVSKRALPILIATTDNSVSPVGGEGRGAYAPIDVSMKFHSLDYLCTRIILPRLLDQRATVLPE